MPFARYSAGRACRPPTSSHSTQRVVFYVIGAEQSLRGGASSGRRICCEAAQRGRHSSARGGSPQMAETWIKFCGCTSWHDARQAVDAGADAIGMIFAPSPRRIERGGGGRDRRAACRRRSTPVTVFVDPSEADVAAVLELFPRAMAAVLRRRNAAISSHVMASERSRRFTSATRRNRVANRCDAYPQALLLFDSFANGLAGGTGTTFAWERIAGIAASRPRSRRRRPDACERHGLSRSGAPVRRRRAYRHRDRRT